MRTNIDIDDQRMADAQAVSGATTKKETVQRGLDLLVRLGRQSEIKRLKGQLRWDGDLDALRRDG